MDPVVVSVVAAITAGLTAAGKDIATSAVQDAYAALKNLIFSGYRAATSDLEKYEKEPQSQEYAKDLVKILNELNAGKDDRMRVAADALLSAVKRDVPALIDADTITALKSFLIEDIEYAGPLLRAKSISTKGEFRISGVKVPSGQKK